MAIPCGEGSQASDLLPSTLPTSPPWGLGHAWASLRKGAHKVTAQVSSVCGPDLSLPIPTYLASGC